MLNKIVFCFCIFFLFSQEILSRENRIIIASTTSTHDTGFLEYINEKFENKFKIKTHVIALGTGQAIEIAKRGDVDILIVHYKPLELEFMNEKYGIIRHDLMYNDYVIVGPKTNNYQCNDIVEFFKIIIKNNLLFISRGDQSGTHFKEKELWKIVNSNPKLLVEKYLEVGQGMGPTLMITNEKKGFTLTDRATWIKYNNKINLKVICQNHPPLLNQYGIILVNPKINSNINYDLAFKYINWIISKEGKDLIENYEINGEQLFFIER
tara:strand:- start:171 stop:968 length:798 start_codon:yes stop_codon:yes gene_type:complete